ncbi:MAG: hypothetical protein ACOY0T_34905 [Myxococcota bacterium]
MPLLLRVGEIEAALEDLGANARTARDLTDTVAEAVIRQREQDENRIAPWLSALLPRLRLPRRLTLRRPEGYAYYALNPLDYARLARSTSFASKRVTVLGIRSIGTSLSAVVCAALRERGLESERATLRPNGHPWNRRCELELQARRVIESGLAGEFVVVDEGPGLSGSSFLSVADALTALGVDRQNVTFFCSRRVDPRQLVAYDAVTRWTRFRSLCIEPEASEGDALDLSAGAWRRLCVEPNQPFPATWKELERNKQLVADRSWLRKFMGFAPYGEPAFRRAELLGEAGFSPDTAEFRDGFASQRWLAGSYFPRPGPPPVLRIAEYLAFRAQNFALSAAPVCELETMLHVNIGEACGRDLPMRQKLEVVTPTICDARLQPHEWLLTPNGRVMKTDCSDHGDDHLFPGPCDIAWDLAGAVVEWRLDHVGRDQLLRAYRRLTRDDARTRLPAYELAYLAFRLGWSRMARLSSDELESRRLSKLEHRYQAQLAERLGLSPENAQGRNVTA